MAEETAVLDIGHNNISDDLEMALVKNNHGKQNFFKTLDNYMEALQKSISVLSLLKDSVYADEANDIELVVYGTSLAIKGDPQLIERFVGFGIANYEDYENDDNEESEEDEGYDSNE